jgi:hypothetical protein
MLWVKSIVALTGCSYRIRFVADDDRVESRIVLMNPPEIELRQFPT